MLQPDRIGSADPLHTAILMRMGMVNAYLPIHIGNATVALSCSIELANLRHPKPLCESLPDAWTQPISHSQSDFVAFF